MPCQHDAPRLDEEAGFTYSANLGCLIPEVIWWWGDLASEKSIFNHAL